MDNDVNCPYCGHGQDICNDDGFGCEPDVRYEEECAACGKTFQFFPSYTVYYNAYKADCLNGGDHDYSGVSYRMPMAPDMRVCSTCDHEIPLKRKGSE